MANINDTSAQRLSKEKSWADSGECSSLVYPPQWVHAEEKGLWILSFPSLTGERGFGCGINMSSWLTCTHCTDHPQDTQHQEQQQQWSHCWALCAGRPWEGSGFHPPISSFCGPLRQTPLSQLHRRGGERQSQGVDGACLAPPLIAMLKPKVWPLPSRALKNINGILFLLFYYYFLRCFTVDLWGQWTIISDRGKKPKSRPRGSFPGDSAFGGGGDANLSFSDLSLELCKFSLHQFGNFAA